MPDGPGQISIFQDGSHSSYVFQEQSPDVPDPALLRLKPMAPPYPVQFLCSLPPGPYESAPEEKYVSKYLDVSNYAKYPFGFGLSYSHFSYQPIQLSALTFTKEQPVTVSVLVRNDSPIAGEETVQFYVRDLVGQVVRPIKELKDFQKVWLEPKEEKEDQFLLSEDMVRYVHSDNQVTSDAGEFIVMIGGNSRDVQTATVTLNE